MKKEGHPPYQEVLFVDTATGHRFVCGSTLQPEATETYEGKAYPVHRVSVSSSSHPFFTGSQRFVDTEGRVERFNKRFVQKQEQAIAEKEQAEEKERERQKERVAQKTKRARPKK